MKKTIINLGLILIAFAIGITINNACAGSLENISDSELRSMVAKMQQDIRSLQNEVNDLKSQLAKLSASGSVGSEVGQYGFVVDGLHFDRCGNIEEKTDYCVSKTEITYDDSPQNNYIQESETRYVRDINGRVIQRSTDDYSVQNGIKTKTRYSIENYTYFEKKCTLSIETKNGKVTQRVECTYFYK